MPSVGRLADRINYAFEFLFEAFFFADNDVKIERYGLRAQDPLLHDIDSIEWT